MTKCERKALKNTKRAWKKAQSEEKKMWKAERKAAKQAWKQEKKAKKRELKSAHKAAKAEGSNQVYTPSAESLQHLEAMGFVHRDVNLHLLTAHNGDIDAVIQQLAPL